MTTFVYRLVPGNANLFSESSELDLAPDATAEVRCWIDADMLFQSELQNPNLRVALLRVPTVVGTGGSVYFNPVLTTALGFHLRPMGFDPICALISDKDVVRAAQLALHSTARGVFNIAGFETVPLSVVANWTGRGSVALPSSFISLTSRISSLLGVGQSASGVDSPHLRYGFSLDTGRARSELGFEPGYRIAPGRAENGRRQLESAPV